MTVADDARRFQAAVEALADDALVAMARALAAVLPALVAEAEAAAQVAATLEGNEARLYAARRARAIAAQVEAEIQRIMRALTPELAAAVDSATLAGLSAAETIVLSQTAIPWTRPPFSAVQALVGASQGESLGSLLDRLGRDSGDRVRDHLTRGLLTGRNPRVVGRAISQDVALSAVRAQTIARTEMLRAYRVSSLAAMRQNGITRYRRLAAKSPRTCALCLALDQQEQDTAELLATHPQCRCVCVPLLGIPGIDERPPESGRAWFDRQPESVQAQILGKGGLQAYRNGASLRDFVRVQHSAQWGDSLARRPLSEVSA